MAVYDDGHRYCFTPDCPSNKKVKRDMPSSFAAMEGESSDFIARKIYKRTSEACGYLVSPKAGVHIANYKTLDGKFVGQKIRAADKKFSVRGDIKDVLYLGHLFNAGGKRIVITEGEIDAISYYQATDGKWPVVSIPNGVSSAVSAIKANYEYLASFEEIVIAFDNDEIGQATAEKCAELLPIGKVKIAKLAHKDFSEYLQKGDVKGAMIAVWNAAPYRPDGIIPGTDLWDTINEPDTFETQPYPWAGMNEITRGLRTQELVVLTSGSGMGKSAVVREIAYSLIKKGEKVGLMFLEESNKRTALGIMGLELNKPLHIDKTGVEPEHLRDAFASTVGNGNVYIYDHFGSNDVDVLISKVRYMAKALGCKWVLLDHISIVVSGNETDERRSLDILMTKLRTLVQETGIGLIAVSHLRRPSGTGHEEGAEPSLNELRGSHSIVQLSDMVIALQRNQKEEDERARNTTNIRVLKNRFSGEVGPACTVFYNKHTGRLSEVEPSLPDTEGDF